MSKKEFAWDKETLVKVIEVSEYERREIRVTELKGKEYVAFTTFKKIKDEWKPTGGYTIPKAIFGDIYDAVNDYDLMGAFGSTDLNVIDKKIQPKEPKVTIKGKKVEPKTATKKTTKAKK